MSVSLKHLLLLIFSVSPFVAHTQSVNKLLQKADSLYSLPYPDESDDLQAIELYQRVIQEVPNANEIFDFVRATENLGNLQLIYGLQSDATSSYRKGLFFVRDFGQNDTLVYTTHLYLGEVLFRMSRLDSAIFHLKEAERIQAKLKQNSLPERLYNALGVYYFETGNYLQSIQYFTQAESYLGSTGQDYEQFARYSFLSNKASALYHLEQYDSARVIYFQLLDWDINPNQVRIHLANTYLKEKNGKDAIKVLDQIEGISDSNVLAFLNLQSRAYLQLNNLTLADSILQLTGVTIDSLGISSKNYQRGMYYSNLGEYYRSRQDFEAALDYLHRSIVELHPSFDSEDVFQNPSELSLGMAAISLFDNLVSKSEVSWAYFRQNKDQKYFDLGLDSYRSAFDLADYISANFDNDEARIFLGDQALRAYKSAVSQIHDFYLTNPDSKLKEQAFIWVEQSKSGALRLGIFDSKEKQRVGIPSDLLREELELQQLIARNYRDQYETEDTSKLQFLKQEYTELQVRLSRLREEIKSHYPESMRAEAVLLTFIQSQLSEDGVMLSFFEGNDYLSIFLLDANSLDWKVIHWNDGLREKVLKWKQQIRSWRSGMTYETPFFLTDLAGQIFKGWEAKIIDANLLTIIPHGVFSGISFDEFPLKGELLIQHTPISYQFSAMRLQVERLPDWQGSAIAGFAPFFYKATDFAEGLLPLPGSKMELNSLSGNNFFGSEASKRQFLITASQNNIIHLATHAVASDEDGQASFVAFYPEGDFRLFENELSFQPLDQVDLIFLSACETGSGRFSESEGFVSLARAFALAGVKNLVSTLWLTEDKVASYLSREFYSELEKGLTYAEALRQAKLNFLNDTQMAQFHDAPYWTNFILVGQPQQKSALVSFGELMVFLLIILTSAGLAYWYWILRSR